MSIVMWRVDPRPRSRAPIHYVCQLDLNDPEAYFDGKSCLFLHDVQCSHSLEDARHQLEQSGHLSASSRASSLWKEKAKVQDHHAHRLDGGCKCVDHVQRLKECHNKCFDAWKLFRNRKEESYNSLLRLYTKIERQLEEFLEQRAMGDGQITSSEETSSSNDMYERSKRDANLPSLSSVCSTTDSSLYGAFFGATPPVGSHYVWAKPDSDKYRSRFLPMRNPDLIRDDLAYRSHVRSKSQRR